VAKILRYILKQHQADTQVARSVLVILRDAELASADKLRDLINKFVRCGLYNMEKYRHSPDDRYHVGLYFEGPLNRGSLTNEQQPP
jgi:hypothetical protein